MRIRHTKAKRMFKRILRCRRVLGKEGRKGKRKRDGGEVGKGGKTR